MHPHRIHVFGIALLVCCLATVTHSAEPWEDVAIKGITAMNRGDGKTFAENSHSEFKAQAQKMLVDRLRADPAAADTEKALKDFGVASADALEKVPLEAFTQKLIFLMHAGLPEPMRTAMEQAQFKAIDSEAAGDTYRVNVEITFMQNGRTRTSQMILLAKREGGVWKYNGHAT